MSTKPRRTALEVRLDILKAVHDLEAHDDGAVKPTHIMYRANISWTLWCKELHFLEAKGLLIGTPLRPGGPWRYRVTELALRLIQDWESISEKIGALSTTFN